MTYQGGVEFRVARTDTTPPPPPPGPVPYVDSIQIVPKSDSLPVNRPICSDDSILVLISGSFPNNCFDIRDVEVRPGIDPLSPPIVRMIVVDRGPCLGQPCIPGSYPWYGAAVLPPLPAGAWHLPIEVLKLRCDSIPPESLFTALVPFGVVDSCGPPQALPCLLGAFEHPNGFGSCDVFLSAGNTASLNFGVNATVPLSGLQGEFRIDPTALQIANLETIGPAQGMHLTWTRTPLGARFVLFAKSGAPIPAAPWPADSVVPILRVTVEPTLGTQVVPAESRIHPIFLLGADQAGGAVPTCPLRDTRIADIFSGRVCIERLCDANGDGLVDVRDLVLLVRCLHGEGTCTDSTGAVSDCASDSAFTLEDVICCARKVLQQGICPHCPPDSTARPEPDVRLSLGSPVGTASGVTVPLRLEGADRIGAARFLLRYPLDRYDVTSVEFPNGGSGWLDLYQVRGADLAIGLIHTAGPVAHREAAVGSVELLIHLRLKPGQEPGGELQATEAEFSGPDGVSLEVNVGRPLQPLGGPAKISLSASRPNPFSGETRFTLTLDRPADVRVGIYDIGGRLVVPLHRGPLAAGERDFVWNGTGPDGSPAANGIYFYRAAANGVTVSRKVILVRGN